MAMAFQFFPLSFPLCTQHYFQTLHMHFQLWMFSQALSSESVFIHIRKFGTLEAPSYFNQFPISYDTLLES